MKEGFYTALGTPFDDKGYFIKNSFEKQVADQIDSGASGLLVMGSMGIQPQIKDSDFRNIAKACVETARGRCPIYVGVMDNSISRVLGRIKSLDGLKIDGVVATAPYYYSATQSEIIDFMTGIVKESAFPLFLYDLPSVVKAKMDIDTVKFLMTLENIKGIKTADILTAKNIFRIAKNKKDFSVFFSGLDIFDVAYRYGIDMSLDGIYSCTAPLAKKMFTFLNNNEWDKAAQILDDIIRLRGILIKTGIFKGFTFAMNLLGYSGNFAPDYHLLKKDSYCEEIEEYMKSLNLL